MYCAFKKSSVLVGVADEDFIYKIVFTLISILQPSNSCVNIIIDFVYNNLGRIELLALYELLDNSNYHLRNY